MKDLLHIPLGIGFLLFQSTCLALTEIWANKMRSVLTTLGIVIGVASVTAVIAALTGLKSKVLHDVESFGTNKIYMWVQRPDSGPQRNASWWNLRFVPTQLEGLTDHCPSVAEYTRVGRIGRLTVRHGERTVDNISLRGIDPAWHSIEHRPVVLGRLFSVVDEEQARNVCLIDPDLRDKLMLDRDCIGQTILAGGRRYAVVGIVERRPEMSMIGELMQEEAFDVFVPYATLRRLREPWCEIIATSKSTAVTDEAQAELRFFLRKNRGIKPGDPDTFRLLSIQSEVKKFNDIALVVTLVAGGVVAISLLVGGIGIMNIMLVSVSERTREIGLRKAVGARRSAILTQFLVEAVVLCLFGGLVGVALGQLLTTILANANPVLSEVAVPGWAISVSFGFAVAVGIGFGMFPAIKAANLDPIEALRHE